MRKKLFILIIALAFFYPSLGEATAVKTASSTELVEKNKFFNGKTVFYQGEVIGDIMIRGRFAWLTVNDDKYSLKTPRLNQNKLYGYNSGLPVTVSARQSRKIKFLGDYKHHGDTVLIKGVFHNACPEHNGVLMIHGQELKVVKKGFSVRHSVSQRKLSLALFSFVLFLLSTFVYFQKTPNLRRRLGAVLARLSSR